jgi:hypothetical protein
MSRRELQWLLQLNGKVLQWLGLGLGSLATEVFSFSNNLGT